MWDRMGRRITTIKVKNFRQFHDLELNFKEHNKNDLNVIIGGNRYGKTNLLNALLWCMYGKEAMLQEGAEEHHFLKNERYMDEETGVEFELADKSNNEKIVFERYEDQKLSFIRKDGKTRKYIPVDEPDIEVKKILPKSIRNLFLFKGEFLDNFFENAEYLKDTIIKVSKLDTLRTIENTLEELESKYQSEITKKNRANKKLDSLNDKIEDYKRTMELVQKRIDGYDYERRQHKKRIDEISKELKNYDEEVINELLFKEKTLKERESETIDDIKRTKKDILEIFLEEISNWYLYDGYKKLKKELDALQEEGLLPPPVTPALIDKILRSHKCIVCERKTTKEIEEKLYQMKKNITEDKPKVDELYKLSVTLFFDKDNFVQQSEKVKKKIEYLIKKEESLNDIGKQLSHVSEELKQINIDKDSGKIRKLNIERSVLAEEMQKLEVKIDEEKASLERHKLALDALQIEFNKEASKVSGTEKISNKLQLTRDLKEKISDVYKEILEKIITELNTKTENYFQQMFWENYQFIDYDIKINDNFELSVVSPEGNDISKFLSTGERKVLALSFIAALSDFYGFDFPYVIDAPFTELQPEVISNVLDTLASLSTKKQILILTIPKAEKIMDKLIKNANTVYKLKKDGSDDTTVERIK